MLTHIMFHHTLLHLWSSIETTYNTWHGVTIGPHFLFLYFLFTYVSCDCHVITSVTIVQVTYCPCDVIVL